MTQFFKNKNRGFTLAEILVVLAIVGLLATIVLVSTTKAIEKAKIARSLRFSSSVHHAVGAYLVGEWRFENDFLDSSGYGHHGQGVGTVSFVDNDIPQLGMAAQFQNTGDYVQIPDSQTLDVTNELTIQGWFRPLSESSEGVCVACKTGSYDLYFLKGAERSWFMFFIVSSEAYNYYIDITDTTGPFKTNQWYHVAATYYGGGGGIKPRITLYLNGHLIVSELINWPSPPYPLLNSSSPLLLGACNVNVTNNLDEIRIYQGELTSAQIKKLYVEGAEKHGLLVKE